MELDFSNAERKFLKCCRRKLKEAQRFMATNDDLQLDDDNIADVEVQEPIKSKNKKKALEERTQER
jgi:hypothetical protein